MNKHEAVEYMIGEIERIERERMAENMSIEPSQKKADVVGKIKKLIEGVEIENED